MIDPSPQAVSLALSVADGAARADVECYAQVSRHPDGFDVYDLTQPQCTAADAKQDRDEAVQIAKRAAMYIRERGDVFPWQMLPVDGAQHLVRFMDKGRG